MVSRIGQLFLIFFLTNFVSTARAEGPIKNFDCTKSLPEDLSDYPLSNANHKAVVHLQVNCPCKGNSNICSTRQTYKASIVSKDTGAVLWAGENIETVMHNDCSVTTVLGNKNPIPATIFDAAYESLGVKLESACNPRTQIVELNQPLKALGGERGPKGEPGERGPQGEPGVDGAPGTPGADGIDGAPGATGPQGEAGPRGADGAPGVAGPRGADGVPGATGPQGPRGEKGERGQPGLAGEAGAPGPVGPMGPQGARGETGARGLQGAIGPQGPQGETGAKGATGETGPQGPQGIAGEPGSKDIQISEEGGKIYFSTPMYHGDTYTSVSAAGQFKSLTDAVATRAEKNHVHALADINGPVPDCVSPSAVICKRGDALYVNGQAYAAMPLYDGKVLQSEILKDLRLDITAGRWNDIGSYDETTKKIITLSGSIKTTEGTIEPINSGGAAKVRVVSGKIQEWHDSPLLANTRLYIEIKYVLTSAALRATKNSRPNSKNL